MPVLKKGWKILRNPGVTFILYHMQKIPSLCRILKSGIFIILFAVVASCQKEINPLEQVPDPEEEVEVTGDSFFPLTNGTTWLFEDSVDAALSYRMTVTGNKKQFGELNFSEVISRTVNGDETPLYYTQKGNEYYMLIDMEEVGGTGSFNMLYLIDQKEVGHTWTKSAGTFNNLHSVIHGEIVSKGGSVTWKGKTYRDVVHTKVDLISSVFGIDMNLMTYEIYSVRGIGMVKVHNHIENMGTDLFINKAFLTDYTIK